MSLTKISNDFNVGRSVHIGRDTVGRILNKYGLRSHRPVFKPFITAKQQKRRIEWARSKFKWDSHSIENLWHIIKNKIIILGPVYADKLWKQIQNIWHNIPSEICRNLVDSMPQRLAAILKMKGHATKY